MYVSQKYYSVETGVHVSKYYLLISQVQYNSYQIQKKKKKASTQDRLKEQLDILTITYYKS